MLRPFKFVERVAQDRIVLEKYAGYWNKDAIHFDKVVYTPIPDATAPANLRSGQLDFIERVASSDIEKLKSDKKLKTASITEIGYQGLTINVGKSEKAQQNPLGKDAGVAGARASRSTARALAQVVMDNGRRWATNGLRRPSLVREERPGPQARRRAPRRCSRRPGSPIRASPCWRPPPRTRSAWRW